MANLLLIQADTTKIGEMFFSPAGSGHQDFDPDPAHHVSRQGTPVQVDATFTF